MGLQRFRNLMDVRVSPFPCVVAMLLMMLFRQDRTFGSENRYAEVKSGGNRLSLSEKGVKREHFLLRHLKVK